MARPYKGRNAKLAVIGFRLTDAELDEVMRAVAKASKIARKTGGLDYVRSDLVRAAVLDMARWINTSGDKHMPEAIAVLEEQFT